MLLLVLFTVSACADLFNDPRATGTVNTHNGSLVIQVPAIASWVARGMQLQSSDLPMGEDDQSRTLSASNRAMWLADSFILRIYNQDGKDVVTTLTSVVNASGTLTVSATVPVGTGYTITVSLFNHVVSRSLPVVHGRVENVTVSASAATTVNLRCTPFEPTPIIANGQPNRVELASQAEHWYVLEMVEGTTYYFAETSNAADMAFFDATGAYLTWHGSYHEITAQYSGPLFILNCAVYGLGTASMTVANQPLSVLAINWPRLTMIAGGSTRLLTASYIPSTTAAVDITWISSDTNVAVVDSSGRVMASGAGSCIITATDNLGNVADCPVIVVASPESPELLVNGDFSQGSDFWTFQNVLPAFTRGDFSNENFVLSGSPRGTAVNQVRLVFAGLPLEKGVAYELSFDASSSTPGDFIQATLLEGPTDINGHPSARVGWADRFFRLTAETRTYSTPLAISTVWDDPDAVLLFHFGQISSGTITLDNVSLKIAGTVTPPVDPAELIYNGDFAAGSLYWCPYLNIVAGAKAMPSFENGQFSLNSSESLRGTQTYHWQLRPFNLQLTGGTYYNIRFKASSSIAGDLIRIAVGEGGVDVDGNGSAFSSSWFTQNIVLGTATQEYSVSFIMPLGYNDPAGRLNIELGNTTGTILIDDISMRPVGTFTPPEPPEMVWNGDFSYGKSYWYHGGKAVNGATALASIEDGRFVLPESESARGTKSGYYQLGSPDKMLYKNDIYRVSFDAWSSVDTDFISIILNEDGVDRNGDGELWSHWCQSDLVLGTKPDTKHTFTWIMSSQWDDPTAALRFYIGNTTGTIVIDNVSLERIGTFVPPEPPEMVWNGDFIFGEALWYYNNHTYEEWGPAAIGDFSLGYFSLTDDDRGTETWHCQLISNDKSLKAGSVYQVSFKASSSNPADVMSVGLDNGRSDPYRTWAYEVPVLSGTLKTYVYRWVATEDDPKARLFFFFGNTSGHIIIDDVSLQEIDANELLVNGDFSLGDAKWTFVDALNTSSGSSISAGNCWLVSPPTGVNTLEYRQLQLLKNTIYQVSFDARSDTSGDGLYVAFREGGIDSNGDGLTNTTWAIQYFALGSSTQRHTATMAISSVHDDPYAMLEIGYGTISTGTISIDNISVRRIGEIEPPVTPELISNGTFDQGEAFWSPWVALRNGATAKADYSTGSFILPASQNQRGALIGDWGLRYLHLPLTGSTQYRLRFDASSSVAGEVLQVMLGEGGVDVNGDGKPHSLWEAQTVTLGNTINSYELILPAPYTDPVARLYIYMGATTGTILIDNVSLQAVGTYGSLEAQRLY
jgi:hypothetical protein